MSQHIALQPIDEPAICSFDDLGNEVLDDKNNDLDVFFEKMEINKYGSPAITKTNRRQKNHVGEEFENISRKHAKHFNEINTISIILNSLDTIGNPDNKPENKAFAIGGTAYTEKEIINPDIPLGSVIVEKQLQFQQSSRFLLDSALELSEYISKSKDKYRKLIEISKKYPIRFYPDQIQRAFIPVIPSNPSSYLAIVLEYRDGEIFWRPSNNVFFNYNNQTIFMNIKSKYASSNSRIILQLLFRSMKNDIIKDNRDYRVHPSSNSISFNVNGETHTFSISDRPYETDEQTPYPLFLPLLVRKIYEVNSFPSRYITSMFELQSQMETIQSILFGKFMKCDFCYVSHVRSFEKLAIQVTGFNNTVALLYLSDGKLILTDPKNQLLFTTIDLSSENSIKRFKKWCDDQFWRLFTTTVLAAASDFGFDSKTASHNITVRCENERKVTLSYLDTDEISVQVKEKEMDLRILWNNIPFKGYFQKLEYLFFFRF